jgi:hypothetical protein
MELHEINTKMGDLLPEKYAGNLSRDILNKLDLLIKQDSELEDSVFDNLVSFKDVLLEGKFGVSSFINATLFVSYYLLGHSKRSSYSKVFPDRLVRYEEEGKSVSSINKIIDSYYRGVLVQRLLGQCLMPSHVMFRNVFYKAIKTQVDIMEDAGVSPTVRQRAADSLMGHLKEPEVQKVEVDVNDRSSNDMVKELMKATKSLARSQKEAIESGVKGAEEIAHSTIIEGEYSEK